MNAVFIVAATIFIVVISLKLLSWAVRSYARGRHASGGLIASKSLCCGAFMRPLGWSQDGWLAECRACGQWQYLGDDYENPPLGFGLSGLPDSSMNAGGHVYSFSRRPAPRPAAIRPDASTGVGPEVTSDEGEPLAVPAPPNIGGVDHPDYKGPHYDVPHTRFIPYDMLSDPIPGTAVHKVGKVAVTDTKDAEKKS